MTRVRLEEVVSITPESFKMENINGVEYPFIDIPLYPFDTQSRNGAVYRSKAGRESYKSFEGRPVLDNHQNESLGDTIGQIHETKIGFWEANGKRLEGVMGRLRLNPRKEDIIEDVKNGFINKGSIGVIVDNEEEFEDGHIECDVVEGLEFSLVNIPGFDAASIQSAQFIFHEAYKKHPKKTKTELTDAERKEPFADFKDMDDCIAKNQDQEDPAAYCAAIKKKAEPESAQTQTGDTMTDEQSERLDKLEAEFKTFGESLDALGAAVKEMTETLKAKSEEKYTPKPVQTEGVIAPTPVGSAGGAGPQKEKWDFTNKEMDDGIDSEARQEAIDRVRAITHVRHRGD